MESLTELMNLIPAWLLAITGLVTAANAITVLTPSKADDRLLAGLLKFLNILSMNFGKNRNKDS